MMVGGDCTVIGTPVSPPHRTLTASPRDSLDTHASRGGGAAAPRGALAAREAEPREACGRKARGREARGWEAGPRT